MRAKDGTNISGDADLSAPNQFVRVISFKNNLAESHLEKKRFAPIWGTL
jgi:hypothetical protein